MFVYKNGVHYIDSLQETVDAREDDNEDEIYISIPEDKWDEFVYDFSLHVYNNKADYKRNSFIISAVLALMGGVVTYFISGHALRPIREFSDKIEEVEAQNLADFRIEENKVKELNQLSISYNKMLMRLSDAFEIQRQFTANAAHELRTPLALMQVQLDLYNSTQHPGIDADTLQTIKMVTEQNDRLNKMVKTLLDMSELQTVGRDEIIAVDALVDEVLADLEPLAQEKSIKLIEKCKDITLRGSDILIYRLVYNLVENAIKYNHFGGQVTVTADQEENQVRLSVEDTGSGIPQQDIPYIFQRFFQSPHSGNKEGTGIGLYLVKTYTELHGGHINGVTSNEGKGTSIGLNIPVIAVEKEEIPATQVKKQLESLPVLKPIEAESQDEKFLSNIIRLIEDHLSESELNVNALCELSGISNKQIYRKIKQLTGMSPVEYIKSIRMKKAAMLLQQKKFTIAEVMYMVGFSNHSYFSKCFQAEFGKTPRQYLNEDL